MADEAPLQVAAPVTALPLSLLHMIWLALPPDARARCAAVCRAWRAGLDDARLWTRLDLSEASRLVCFVDDEALAAAAAKARGSLTALDVSGRFAVSADTLLAVVRANAGALRDLREVDVEREPTHFAVPDEARSVEALLRAAPHLRELHTDAGASYRTCDAVRAMLRNEPPYGPLRLHDVEVAADVETPPPADDVEALAAEIAAHASLTSLKLLELHIERPAVFADAALSLRLSKLALISCNVPHGLLPALARVLAGGALRVLTVERLRPGGLLDAEEASVAELCAALRANATLTELTLRNSGLWDHASHCSALLAALTGHASVHVLFLDGNTAHTRATATSVGRLLGALVAADAPALTELDISDCALTGNALRPVVCALARNTHLRRLAMCFNGISARLVQQQLLPALDSADWATRIDCVYGEGLCSSPAASSCGEESDDDDGEEEEEA
jgi:hypothetical protein